MSNNPDTGFVLLTDVLVVCEVCGFFLVLCSAHCEPIVRLQFYPFQTPQAEKNGGQGRAVPKTRAQLGRYLSVSRDGILNYWSERFKLTRTVNVSVSVCARHCVCTSASLCVCALKTPEYFPSEVRLRREVFSALHGRMKLS